MPLTCNGAPLASLALQGRDQGLPINAI